MKTNEFLVSQFQAIERHLPALLEDIIPDQLYWQPSPRSNSLGFILWHLLYTWDEYLSIIQTRPVIYIKEDGTPRFNFDVSGRGIEGGGMGTGFAPEDVAMVRPEPGQLLDYLEELLWHTNQALGVESESTLPREITVPWWPEPVPAARVYSHIITHSYFHLGEAQYLKGLSEQQ